MLIVPSSIDISPLRLSIEISRHASNFFYLAITLTFYLWPWKPPLQQCPLPIHTMIMPQCTDIASHEIGVKPPTDNGRATGKH